MRHQEIYVCEAHEGIRLKLNWDMLRGRPKNEADDVLYYEDGKLAGFLATYIVIPTEAELSGMVHPGFRRQGIFTRMLRTALHELQGRGPKDVIYICPRNSASGQAFLRQHGVPYSFSEYVMERNETGHPSAKISSAVQPELRLAGADDAKLLAELIRVGFDMTEHEADSLAASALSRNELTYIAEAGDGRALGKISVLAEGGTGFIYGFCVWPEERGRGVDRAILARTIGLMERERGLANFRLEVAAKNERAIGLYESCGFRVISVIDYYKEPVPVV